MFSMRCGAFEIAHETVAAPASATTARTEVSNRASKERAEVHLDYRRNFHIDISDVKATPLATLLNHLPRPAKPLPALLTDRLAGDERLVQLRLAIGTTSPAVPYSLGK